MADTEPIQIKYIFLDVVGFTRGRHVEAQVYIVGALNRIVTAVLAGKHVGAKNRVFLPTGDGMCIALIDVKAYDIHLLVALDILAKIAEHNEEMTEPVYRFQVRVGINQNADNIVTDINGRRNVAGQGINMSQRIMSLADEGQILVSHTVHEILSGRKKYMPFFRRYEGEDKHGNQFPVHQYVADNCFGLNIEPPTSFLPKPTEEKRLTKLAAYYLVEAIKNRDSLFAKREDSSFDIAATVLLYMRALDDITQSEASQYDKPIFMTYEAGKATFEEQYRHYIEWRSKDWWASFILSRYIVNKELSSYDECFEKANLGYHYAFVSRFGIEKLKRDWSSIWKRWGLEEVTSASA